MPESQLTPAQARIADATIQVVAEEGFDVVSVRTVAARANVSGGTIQYHYPTRQSLITAAFLRSVERQVERIYQSRPDAPSYHQALVKSLSELLPLDGVRREDATVWVSYAAAASTRSWLAEPFFQALCRFRDEVLTVLQRAEGDGKLRPGLTAESAAPLVTALVNGITIDHLNSPLPDHDATIAALEKGLSLIVTD